MTKSKTKKNKRRGKAATPAEVRDLDAQGASVTGGLGVLAVNINNDELKPIAVNINNDELKPPSLLIKPF